MSITKVAKEAGVSKSTVSRVINQVPGVTESVRQSVLEAMNRLGYQPSARRPGPKPKSRKGMRTGNIMLLALGYSPAEVYGMPVFPALLHGVEIALREAGLNLVVAGYQADGPLPTGLGSDQVDGVLVMGRIESINDALRNKLGSLPVVGLLRGAEASINMFDRVQYNNRAIGPMVAQYLIEREHKHVAYVNPDPMHPAFMVREQDFATKIKQAGLDYTSVKPSEPVAPTLAAMRDLVGSLKVKVKKITGFAVSSDISLPAFYQALEEVGIQPGSGVDVIGCDNEEQFLSQLNPRPATVAIHPEIIGRHAVRQLIWRMGNQSEESRITLMVEPSFVLSS